MEVLDEEFMGGAGHVIEARVPCSGCGETTVIRFTIAEEDVTWDTKDQTTSD
jgi:hypothetical protein